MKSSLIERYLYDVVRRLPEKQRKDIEEELRTLIEDMAEERAAGGEVTDDIIKSVLSELGDPAKLAGKYRGEGDCLIGGIYYSLYCQVLKIVLICVAAGMVLATGINFFVTATTDSVDGWIQSMTGSFIDIASIVSALVQAVGFVTIIFWIMQKKQVKPDKEFINWDISKLPHIPDKKAVISKGDSIVGIVFGILVIVMFIFAPQFMGAWITNATGEVISIPALDLAIWSSVLPLMITSIAAGIIDDLTKLINGRYNAVVMIVNLITNCIVIAMTFLIFKGHQIWNPSFLTEITSLSKKVMVADYDVISHWNRILTEGTLSNAFVIVICVGALVDILITVYRTLRYGMRGMEE